MHVMRAAIAVLLGLVGCHRSERTASSRPADAAAAVAPPPTGAPPPTVDVPRPTPVTVIDASPLPAWAPLVKDIRRRLLRGDAPEDIIAPLRASTTCGPMGGYPSSVPWLSTIDAHDGGEGRFGTISLQVAIDLPAADVIAELGHYVMESNRHQEAPDDLWFDAVTSPHGEVQILAAAAEFGVVPPAGNINLFEFHLERPVDAGVGAGGAGVPPADAR